MSTCQELREMYDLYALGVLEPEEAAELDSHLRRGCPDCSSGVQQALSSSVLLATLPEQVDPPPRLRKRILDSVTPEKPRWTWAWVGAWAAATAALVFTIVSLKNQNTQQGAELAQIRDEIRRDAADLVNARAALKFLNEPETKQVVFGQGQPKPPRGRVFVNPNRGVMLMVANLPQAPAGKLYELWLIPKTGAPQPAGLFQSDSQGNALYLREGLVDLSKTGAVAITLEPEAGSNAPTTTPLFVAPMSGL